MYQIKDTDVAELEAYIQEIPFKYATAILNFLNAKLVKIEEPEVVNPETK
jgi:hypothetical protein